ncbi:hypothetical protein [Roseobacter sp. S98]|uniref:hypothetical protein n=1 Tax=Roseobacter algicola (ex Choi et al. 2025) (nom. illeg.) TaxID=3092138 RepID=UPI0035C67C13
MIFGAWNLTDTAFTTPRVSYRLDLISAVSVERPLLPLGVFGLIGGCAFAWRFHDLLYPQELLALAVGIPVLAILGVSLGHMKLLSRDLRGTPQMGAIWGTARHLNQLRREIMTARDAVMTAVPS